MLTVLRRVVSHRYNGARTRLPVNGSFIPFRALYLGHPLHGEDEVKMKQGKDEAQNNQVEKVDRGNKKSLAGTPYVEIDPETSIRYVHSKAYNETYGDDPVWLHYRRNFKGQVLKPTRKMCIRGGNYATGNPCPICRDNHLVPSYRNVKLLKQFISPYSGKVLDSLQTNICQKQHKNILVSVEQAWDYGLLDMPFIRRNYDYKDYYGDLMNEETTDVKEAES